MTDAPKLTLKLTPPQRELLRWLSTGAKPRHVVRGHKPALRLGQLGLATLKEVPPPYGLEITISDAGRAALAHLERVGK